MKPKSLLLFIFSILFSISAVQAHVNVIYPQGGENFNAGEVKNIRWEVAIAHGPNTWELYYSDDGGVEWEIIADGLQQSQLNFLWTVPQNATTAGRIRVVQNNATGPDYDDISGDFTINASSGISSSEYEIPGHFTIEPAYPNPFNSSTRIAFSLPAAAKVKVEIYNIVGNKVAELLNRQMPAGLHEVIWNAGELPSGMYFCRFHSGVVEETTRLILMK
ncbi:MAG: T9SS type A sorting domain-containing protein [Calditrichia bacterium]